MLGASNSKSNAPPTDVPDVGARGQHCFAYHTVPPLTAGRLCLSLFGNVQFALCVLQDVQAATQSTKSVNGKKTKVHGP